MTSPALCRLCLAKDVDMHPIAASYLKTYEKITKLSLSNGAGTLTMVCYICHHLLKKSLSFLTRCMQIEKILQENRGIELTNTHISKLSVDINPSLGVSSIEHTSLGGRVEPVDDNVKNEPLDLKQEHEDNSEGPDEDEIDLPDEDESTDSVNNTKPRYGLTDSNKNKCLNFKPKEQLSQNNLNSICNEKKQECGSIKEKEKKRKRLRDMLDFETVLNNYDELATESYGHSGSLILDNEKAYICNHCGKGFQDKKDIINHLQSNTSKMSRNFSNEHNLSCLGQQFGKRSEITGFPCNQCKKTFKNKKYLAKHLKTHTAGKPHTCSHCSKAFSSKTCLIAHTKIHVGDKCYQCDHCQQTFNHKGNLAKHVKIHTGQKPHGCIHCSKTFIRKAHLNVHVKTHTREKPLKCDSCSSSFNSKSDLIKHSRIHTGIKPHACSYCPKSFNRKDHLRLHIRTHTGEKPHVCKTCSKGFNSTSDLAKHLRIHTGESPYRCVHCDKGFKQKGGLKNHQCDKP